MGVQVQAYSRTGIPAPLGGERRPATQPPTSCALTIMVMEGTPKGLKTFDPKGDDLREAAMQYLLELELSAGARPNSWAEGRDFIESYIFPTLERCRALAEGKRIIAGGPQSGSVALSLIVEAATAGELDELITSLPVWPRMETSVIPLTTFEDRRRSILALLETVKVHVDEKQSATTSR